jgi:hypothetical protein
MPCAEEKPALCVGFLPLLSFPVVFLFMQARVFFMAPLGVLRKAVVMPPARIKPVALCGRSTISPSLQC